MRKKLWIFSTGLFFCTTLFAQDTLIATTTATTTAVDTVYNSTQLYKATKSEQVYKLKPAVDIPVTAIGAGWSAFAFGKIYSKDPSTTAKILSLKVSDLNGFDRWAADEFSESAAKTSDLFFYGSMPMPILLLLDKHIRRDAPKIAFLYLQAMSVTGLLYTGSTFLVDRYRPLAYNPEATMEERTGGGAKNSFFAGHVALVGTATFFTAKILSDYHPDSKWRPVFFGAAALATGATGYLRHRGGKHFPSDILIGTTVGTLSGILVPHFHKNKVFKNTGLTVLPFTGKSTGLYVSYKL